MHPNTNCCESLVTILLMVGKYRNNVTGALGPLVAALVVLVQKRGVLKSVVRGSSDFILGLERFNHTREPFQMLDQR